MSADTRLIIVSLLLLGTVFLVLGSIVNASWKQERDRRASAPCSEFSNDDIRFLPARCLPYFQDAGVK